MEISRHVHNTQSNTNTRNDRYEAVLLDFVLVKTVSLESKPLSLSGRLCIHGRSLNGLVLSSSPHSAWV